MCAYFAFSVKAKIGVISEEIRFTEYMCVSVVLQGSKKKKEILGTRLFGAAEGLRLVGGSNVLEKAGRLLRGTFFDTHVQHSLN